MRMKLRLPYNGEIFFSSPYGDRTLNGVPDWHNGIDLVGRTDKTILAPCDGTVGVSAILDPETDPTRTWEWGNYIRIDADEPDSDTLVYLCHLSERLVRKGQRVKAGDIIGIEGSTGHSFGSHLHLEVRKNGTPADPCPYLGIENTAGTTLRNPAPVTEPAENPASPSENASPSGKEKDGCLPHEWAEEAVGWAVANGILLGSSKTEPDYRLHDSITREEAVTLLWRAVKGG